MQRTKKTHIFTRVFNSESGKSFKWAMALVITLIATVILLLIRDAQIAR